MFSRWAAEHAFKPIARLKSTALRGDLGPGSTAWDGQVTWCSMPRVAPERRFVIACLIAATAGVSRDAVAHAILVSSHPRAKGTVPPGPVAMSMTFNSRIDPARSSLTLTRPDKTRLAIPIIAASGPDTLVAETTLLPGPHVLRWQVLALDGHITRGDIPFTVADR